MLTSVFKEDVEMLKVRRLPKALIVLAIVAVVGIWQLAELRAQATAGFVFDMNDQGKTINNKFSVLNSWYYKGEWTTAPSSYPDDYISSNFPFIERVHLMTATGGSLQRDLFRNPLSGRGALDDYNFEPLKQAIRQVLRQGLKPYIKTGNVPMKYSDRPVIGVFGVNVKPPKDYDVYYEYIKALAESMVEEFGIDEVKTWWWGVLTEYENKDWFDAGDPESTKIAYFKLYDYTVAALEEVLGPENVFVGAHSMSVIPGYWDEREFLEHVVSGTNYKTGEKGTQIDFLAVSYYDNTLVGLDGQRFIRTIEEVRQKALSLGLTDLLYGVDEGRVLVGWDGKELTSRVVNFSAQATADAKLFKLMVEHDVDYFSTWGLTTERIWGGANVVSTNLANLVYRMTGDKAIGGGLVRRSSNRRNEVDGLASFDESANILRILVYNNSSGPTLGSDDSFEITINNIQAVEGTTVTIEEWRIDDEHANWWPTWWEDQKEHGLTDDDYDWSRYSAEIPRVLINREDKEFWRSREPEYIRLGELTSTTFEAEIEDNTLVIKDDIARHGVVFYEIRFVKSN